MEMKKLFDKTMRNTAGVLILAASATLASGNALAITTLVGNDVSFTFDETLLGLFGTPTVTGNSIQFAPLDFSAESLGGAGFALRNATVNIQVVAHAGYQLAAINLNESGTLALAGAGSSADVTGQIRVFDLQNPIANEVTGSLAPTLGASSWTAGAGVVIPTVDWRGSGTVNGVNLTIENILLANSIAADGLASIQKTFVGANIQVSPVPEADTWAMLLAGLGLVGFMARRRAASGA